MSLNKSTGNMYEFITHTFNTIKGECFHDCDYCYMKRWGHLKPVRLDEKEFKTDLGSGNFIFVGSSCDMFAENIPFEWIQKTINYLLKFDNKYFLQTKNTGRLFDLKFLLQSEEFIQKPGYFHFEKTFSLCTTIETNRHYTDIMRNSPSPLERFKNFRLLGLASFKKYITIEPIMDFDLEILVEELKKVNPIQVNIGSDSGNHKLPEPSKEKVLQLISELEKFTIIHNKTNLKRLLKSKKPTTFQPAVRQ